jgi:acetoin utilization protein AcuB
MTILVRQYMTPSPHTIGRDQTLDLAAQMMREHHIRHLPVLVGGHLVGMLTERDIALVETLKAVDPTTERVEDAMSQDCYTVTPHDPLPDVAGHMAEHKYGSAVVTEHGKVVGVLTTVDICRAFAEVASRA